MTVSLPPLMDLPLSVSKTVSRMAISMGRRHSLYYQEDMPKERYLRMIRVLVKEARLWGRSKRRKIARFHGRFQYSNPERGADPDPNPDPNLDDTRAEMKLSQLVELAQKRPTPYDASYLQYQRQHPLGKRRPFEIANQDRYADNMRNTNQGMRGHYPDLFSAVASTPFCAQGEGFAELRDLERTTPNQISIMRYARIQDLEGNVAPDVAIVYFHGGGLKVGYADSEELTCRRLVLEKFHVFSVEYRLMPQNTARDALADAYNGYIAAQNYVAQTYGIKPRMLLVGSSSGGELAALVSQQVDKADLVGVLLRCPVTSDVLSGKDQYLPDSVRGYHHSSDPAWTDAMVTYLDVPKDPGFEREDLLGYIDRRENPRDGLSKMPIEASSAELQGMPRTWIQVCLNDVLYSDGVAYAIRLAMADVQVEVSVVEGWPHTFWLGMPELRQSADADRAMLEGLRWILQG